MVDIIIDILASFEPNLNMDSKPLKLQMEFKKLK